MPRIALCCFGITRSLTRTIRSIRKNAIAPARAAGVLEIHAHFFDQTRAVAVTGKTEGRMDVREGQLLSPDHLETEPSGSCLTDWDFEGLKSHGDSWNNDFISLRNLVHQLHSLDRVTASALTSEPDICLFCRPDLRYHDSLAPVLERAQAAVGSERVFLPRWQSWGGYNDRFAVAVGSRAITAYGQRIRKAAAFCAETDAPLHAELLVKYALDAAGIEVEKIPTRASRVRASGVRVWESFGTDAQAIRHEQRKAMLWSALNNSGLKPTVRQVARLLQLRHS